MEDIIGKYKAVADETRFRILILLADGDRCVCDIEHELDMSQSLISQHLSKLKNARLIKDRKIGKWRHYYITEEGRKFFKTSINDILLVLKKNHITKKRGQKSGLLARSNCREEKC